MTGLRVVLPTVAVAVLTSGVAIVINMATDGRAGVWSWLAVVVLTGLSAAAAIWLRVAEQSFPAEPSPSVEQALGPAPHDTPAPPSVQQSAVVTGGSVQQAGGNIINVVDQDGRGR